MRTSCSVLISIVLAALGGPATAAAYPPYDNGFVTYRVSLEYMLPKGLHDAAELLRKGDLNAARPLFEKEVTANPSDYAAWVGFAQTCPADWAVLLPQYVLAAKASPPAVNEFKMGLFAYYIVMTRIQADHKMAGPELADIWPALRVAYAESMDPAVGFTLEDSCCLGGEDDPRLVLEDMLYHFDGGGYAYATYAAARDSDWDAAVPPIRQMDPERLFLMGKILRYLYSNYGETSGNTQPTVHQVKAMRFLRQWGDECILASNLPSLEP